MSEYLDCGHPSGCELVVNIEFPEPWTGRCCLACERGGWVYVSEGLPAVNTVKNYDVAYLYDWLPDGVERAAVDIATWTGKCWAHDHIGPEDVYAYRERPDPPPLPEV